MAVRQFGPTSFESVNAYTASQDTSHPEARSTVPMLINAEKDPAPPQVTIMHQISVDHARSLVEGAFISTRKCDFITHGASAYSARVLKGNTSYSEAFIKERLEEDEGLYIYGLCTASTEQIERLLRSSRFCEEHGIDAERIVNIHILEEIVDGRTGEKIPIDEFKRRLIERYSDQIPNLEERLSKLHFIVWERLMPIAERIMDLDAIDNKKQFFRLVRKVLNNINRLEDLRGNNVHFSRMEFNSFITKYLIPNTARNLGRLHAMGVATSGYCLPSNIDLSGALCDLEDLIGVPIDPNDRELTEEDYIKDTHTAFSNNLIISLLADLQLSGLIQADINLLSDVKKIFFATYFNERFGDKKVFKLSEILNHIKEFPISEQIEILEAIYGVRFFGALTYEKILSGIKIEDIKDIKDIRQAIDDCAFQNSLEMFVEKYGQVPIDLIHELHRYFGHTPDRDMVSYLGNIFRRYFLYKYDSDQSKLPEELGKVLRIYPDYEPFTLLQELLGVEFDINGPEDPEMEIVEFAKKNGIDASGITPAIACEAIASFITMKVVEDLSGRVDSNIIGSVTAIVMKALSKYICLNENATLYKQYAIDASNLFKRLTKL